MINTKFYKILLLTVGFLGPLNPSESNAEISCSFGNDGKSVTITGTGGDEVPISACNATNSTQGGSVYTPPSDWVSNLTDVTIGAGITGIGNNAFKEATSLTEISIPEGVTSIGDSAFQNAKKITEITIPNSVTSIGKAAFKYANSLESITIPKGVTSIEKNTFESADNLKNIIIMGPITSIGTDAFKYTGKLEGIICKNTENACASLANMLPEKLRGKFSYVPSSDEGDSGGNSSNPTGQADCSAKNQVYWEGKCLDEYPFAKKHWTPAEAAEWLNDGNDNFVVLTFKK